MLLVLQILWHSSQSCRTRYGTCVQGCSCHSAGHGSRLGRGNSGFILLRLVAVALNGWRRENVRKNERIGEKEERKESQEDIK